MKAEHKGRYAALFLYWCMIGVLIVNTYGNTSVLAAEEIESTTDDVIIFEGTPGNGLPALRDDVRAERDKALKLDTWEATEAESDTDLSEEIAIDDTTLVGQNCPEMIIDYYSDDDVSLLARVVTREGRSLSYEEKRAIADTVLARVDSEVWPNDLYSVIAQPGQYGGSLKRLPKNPSQEALDVAFEALEYWNLTKNGFTPEEDWTLPDEFMSFFGDGKHNYFYYYDSDGSVVFCDCVPNAPLPENIDKLYRRYTGKKVKAPKTEVETEAETETKVETEAKTEAEDKNIVLGSTAEENDAEMISATLAIEETGEAVIACEKAP